jgi:hypothetical protein
MADNNLVRSISRSGNVGGKAALERFFSLKADALSGKRIAPEARLAQMRPIASSNSTMRSGVRLKGSSERSHNERFWNGRLLRKADVGWMRVARHDLRDANSNLHIG